MRCIVLALLFGVWGCDDGTLAEPPPVCTPEVCDGIDNDCDEFVDEGFNLVTNPNTCGRCDRPCAFEFAEALCIAGECVQGPCAPGRVDLDGDSANGCEAQCRAETRPELCDGRDDDCDGRVDEDYDLTRSLVHCGACNTTCAPLNADGQCVDGQCEILRCRPGFADDNGQVQDGCEAPCAPAAPGPEICDDADNDCDGRADEAYDLTRDPEHCGRCGVRCDFANAAGRCVEGGCELAACEPGFVDADGDWDNGCEQRCTPSADGVEVCNATDDDCDGRVDEATEFETDPQNCGGCGRLDAAFICSFPNAVADCIDAQCVLTDCTPGFVDADLRVETGCESPCVARGDETCDGRDEDCDGRVDEAFDTQTDPAHCGGCDAACQTGNATPRCVGGRCEIEACPPGQVDADQDPRTGCEYACVLMGEEQCNTQDDDCDGRIDEGFDIFANPAHCGGCDRRCAPANAVAVCDAGRCDIAACEMGWFDANADAGDGCEVACSPAVDGIERCNAVDDDCDGAVDEGFDLQRDLNHCGACELRCGFANGALECDAGECSVLGCLDGWYDLNADPADGCEYRCDGALDAVEACNGFDDDCDGMIDEDFDQETDPWHCGGCGLSCAAPSAETGCVAGACAIIACVPGTRDANGLAIDGCESDCIPAADPEEICDGRDQDCDGRVDEAFDLLNDVERCGECDRRCVLPRAEPFCNAGRCAVRRCLAGFADADGLAENGCECAISNGGVEICDGEDNDCNGIVDDADQLAPPPAVECLTLGVCAEVRPACRAARWVCPYPAAYEADETRCDTIDNDCDGGVDEAFVTLGRPCAVGMGACGATGEFACIDFETVGCNAEAVPDAAMNEICNGVDDDCDGVVDESADVLVTVPADARGPAFGIYAFEASRIDATPDASGVSFARACSRGGVLPWTGVSAAEAEAACAQAGLAVCTANQWARACGGTGAQPYPYGPQYQSQTCNGLERDADPDMPGAQDSARPTGQTAGCRRRYFAGSVWDQSGNVWEWVAGAGGVRQARGGSFGNVADGLTCDFELNLPGDTQRENVGFRCCSR